VSAPTRQRRRPVQRRSQEMVDRILEAAGRVLGREGYAAMSTNRVAAEAGVSIGSLYRYFNDKAEIVEHLRARVNQEVLGELTDAIFGSLDDDARTGVERVLHTLVDALERHRGVLVALIDEVPLGSQANTLPEIERQLTEFTRLFVLRHAPDLPREELDARLYLAMGMTLNACLRIALERPEGLDRGRLLELVTEMLVSGLDG
jgi:AcrR family transcriptional regulator